MAGAEQLLAFGPFAVNVCEGPVGIFKWQRKNVTVIELTDRCHGGIPSRGFGLPRRRASGGDPAFEIPDGSIVSAQMLPFPSGSPLRVLHVTYSEAERARERPIASYVGRIERAFAVLERYALQLG